METSANISMSEQKAISITNIIKQFRQKLFGFVRGKVSNTEDAEDILQDVWYQLSNLTDIDDLENVSAWLYQVARNKITDKSRKKKNLALEEYTYENEEGEFNFKEIFWKEFQIALDELPSNQREVFLLNEMEDMTLQQIADQKGENLKTIISRKGYAVKHLRNKLNYLYEELNA